MARRRTSITRTRFRAGLTRARELYNRMGRYKEQTERIVGQVVQTVEIQAGAFCFGWLQGRHGDIDVMGVPVDVGAAAVGHLLGYLRIAGKYSEHLHNLSDGALAVYVASKGAEIGQRMAQESDSTSGVLVGGSAKAFGPARRPMPHAARNRDAVRASVFR